MRAIGEKKINADKPNWSTLQTFLKVQQSMNKQFRQHITIYLLMSLFFISSCSQFGQNDFVVKETILNEPSEQIFYSVYQTGIDNYRFDFFATSSMDTNKLFEYYLNDAVYTAMKFTITKNGNTLKIKTNLPTEKISAMTKNKTNVILTNE